MVDLLSCSGTTTPTIEQIAQMILGDEAYGTNWGYPQLMEQFERVFGISRDDWNIYLFHQGRTAEHALFTEIGGGLQRSVDAALRYLWGYIKRGGKRLKIPSNGHFDTTRANIEVNDIEAIDIPVTRSIPDTEEYFFGGNIDTDALKDILSREGKNVPLVYCTITNNTIGGRAVSLKNMHKIQQLCGEYDKPFFLDACRFAQNAYQIQKHEAEYKNKTKTEIVHETIGLCHGFTISLKKDGLGNMGGALVVRKNSPLFKQFPEFFQHIKVHQLITEGHRSYGGTSGRDIMVNVEGLKTCLSDESLESQIGQVQRFGEYCKSRGLPVEEPYGSHALYFRMKEYRDGTNLKQEDFVGISVAAKLIRLGPRLCELGAFAFGKYDPKTGKETFPPFDLLRAAIPRNKYEIEDLYFVADCLKYLFDNRDKLPKAVCTHGKDLALRHFDARFELQTIK
jgi:tryptophanase